MSVSSPPVVDAPLFFLDYDGTLAPIVDEPSEAYPHPAVSALLEQLSESHPLWIITGRHLRDLSLFLELPLNAVGLHGAQHGTIGGEAESLMPDQAREALQRLRASVPDLEGLRIEDKEQAFAVHYRSAPDTEAARSALREWAEGLPDLLEPIWGKMVVELRAQGLDKGTAVRRITGEYPDRTPVYLGDDVTDEDAFEALPAEAITVKVGNGRETAARYMLGSVEDVVAYLKRYVE